MKVLRQLTAIFFLSVLVLATGCKNKDEEGADRNREERIAAMIDGSEGTFAVFSVNVNSLIEKSGLNDGVLPMDLQFLMDQFLQYINDESMTGIDLTQTVHLFSDTDGASEPEYFVINFVIKDEAAFQAFVEKELNFKMISDEKEDDEEIIPIAQSRDKQMIASWDEGRGMIINANSRDAAKLSEKYLEKLYTLQRKAEINENTLAYLNNKADISFYSLMDNITTLAKEEFNKNDGDAAAIDMLNKIDSYSEGTTSAAYIYFENGAVVMKSEVFLNDKFTKDFPILNSEPVKKEILNYLSHDGNAVAAATISLNMDAVWKFFDFVVPESESEKIDGELKTLGIALKMLKSAVSGDMAFALTGFNFGKLEEAKISNVDDQVYFTMAFSTKNPAVLNEIFTSNPDISGGNGFCSAGKMDYIITDKYLIVTSDKNLGSNLKNGKTTALKIDGVDKLTKSPMNGILNFDALSVSLKDLEDDSVSDFLSLFEKISFHGDMNNSEFKLYFKDKDKNSLRVITAKAVEGAREFM